MKETYFAYRLPNHNEVHYVKGVLSKKNNIQEIDDNGVVFCSFDRSSIYQMTVENAERSEFRCNHFHEIQRSTTKEEYAENFYAIEEQLAVGRFEKIVLSRVKRVQYQKDLLELFDDLNSSYNNTFNYLVNSPELGCWMGASPELLCSIKDAHVKTVSLAGTKSKSQNWTEKEMQEQLYVTNYIERKMTDISCHNIQKEGPKSIKAGPVEHLKTIITCDLTDQKNWRDAIDALHPTPATCGLPTTSSMNFIQKLERHDRKYYTGFIGVFTQEAKRNFVNLRCMEMGKENALIYTGGGITADSNLQSEWNETERKAKTLENLLKEEEENY